MLSCCSYLKFLVSNKGVCITSTNNLCSGLFVNYRKLLTQCLLNIFVGCSMGKERTYQTVEQIQTIGQIQILFLTTLRKSTFGLGGGRCSLYAFTATKWIAPSLKLHICFISELQCRTQNTSTKLMVVKWLTDRPPSSFFPPTKRLS